ncbi:MAG: GTP-binding protein [Cyanobacteria bacterium P01_F01_bin.150]
MMRPRVVFLLISLGLITLIGLWLVGAVAQIYSNLATIAPWLATGFLVVFFLVLAVIVGGLSYYAYLFLRPQRLSKRTLPTVSDDPAEAVAINLDAVQQQVETIQDEVEKAALRHRSDAIRALMEAGDFQVVIFGVGSAGKTSTLNAILGRIANTVSAPMGTTTTSRTYRLQFQGVKRCVLLTDTPGILEASIWGDQREEQARQLATEADLLLFIVDNDMLQTEYDVLRRLVELGKRSLLVFNKVDLYTDDEQEQVLTHLRHRVQPLLEPEDVVAIAANPAEVVFGNGNTDNAQASQRLQPEPDISSLLTRMATILRWEGETLMAENILLQSQRLGVETRRLINQQREDAANAVIEKYQWVSGGVISVMPLPGIDFLATAAINAQMVIEIGRVYGCEINRDRAKELAISLAKTLGGLGLVKGAFELWSTTLKLNVATVLIGQVLQGVTGAYLTRIAGKSFMEYFRKEQTWGDGGISEVVQQQFQLNRRDEFIQTFIQQAITKIVTPLVETPQSSKPERLQK